MTTDQGQTNNDPASAPLNVVNQPTVAKAFGPNTVNVGGASTLTVTHCQRRHHRPDGSRA